MEIADAFAPDVAAQTTTRWACEQSQVGKPVRGFLEWSLV